MTRKELPGFVAAIPIAATLACSSGDGVGPPPPVRPPSVAQRVAASYRAVVLPVPTGHTAVALALSDSGEVAGWDVAFVLPPGSDPPPNYPASYTNISSTVTTARAFVWSKTAGYRFLPIPADVPPFIAPDASFVTAINSHGVMVGAYAYTDSASRQFREVPVRWSGAGVQLLPLPEGVTHAHAIDVDESGALVLVLNSATSAMWLWRDGSGYTQIATGYPQDFQPMRFTSAGIAGAEGGNVGAPVTMGGSSGTIWPQPAGPPCRAYAFSRAGASIGWCYVSETAPLQMAVWPGPARQPSLAGTPTESIRLYVVSDGGVAAGLTWNGPHALVAYDAASGVVPILPRVVNASEVAALNAGWLCLPRAINARGAILCPTGNYAPFFLDPQ